LALGLLEPLSRSNESRRKNKETPMKKTEKNQKKLTLHKLTVAALTQVTGGQGPCTGQCTETSVKNGCH
jgi:hypothetical protein